MSLKRVVAGNHKGQSLVLFALAVTAIFAMLAVAIDAGFLWGQKRFMQNGADSAALAAATLLADNAAAYPESYHGTIPIYFLVNDHEVRDVVNRYVQQNQNPGIATRTISTTYDLSYLVSLDGVYDPEGGGNQWVSSPTGDGKVPDGAYQVRVRPRSTIQNLFGGIIGQAEDTARATAVAAIYGAEAPTEMTGWLWPLTTWDRNDTGTGETYDFALYPDEVYQLWGSSVEYKHDGKQVNLGSWKNVLDFTPTGKWGDGAGADYKFPAPPEGVNSNDPVRGRWNRQGFAQDPEHPGAVQSDPDLAYWSTYFFNGTVRVGNQIPVYVDALPSQTGDIGNNIAQGVYGRPMPDWDDCFFCDPNKLATDSYSGPPYNWGPYRVVVIALWNNAEWWKEIKDPDTGEKVWKWVNVDHKEANGPPDRLQITKFHFFKVYRDYETSRSRVYGQWKSGVVPPMGPPDDPPPPPNSWFNSVRLVE